MSEVKRYTTDSMFEIKSDSIIAIDFGKDRTVVLLSDYEDIKLELLKYL